MRAPALSVLPALCVPSVSVPVVVCALGVCACTECRVVCVCSLCVCHLWRAYCALRARAYMCVPLLCALPVANILNMLGVF